MNIRNIIKRALLWQGFLFHNNRNSKLLFYHDVFRSENYKAKDADVCMGTPLSLFMKHIDVIRKEGFRIVPRIKNKEGEVCIMFDDGFRGIYECRDYFYKNDIKPTVFLAVDYIGTEGMLTKEEILELQAKGFNFECHSWSHNVLTRCNDEELKKELGESRTFLSGFLGKDVIDICLPVGYYNEHLLEQIQKYGYENVYSSIPGDYVEKTRGRMIRRNLCQFSSPAEVRLILRGGNEAMKQRYERLHYIKHISMI